MEANFNTRLKELEMRAESRFGWSFSTGMTILSIVFFLKKYPYPVIGVPMALASYHWFCFFFWRKGLTPMRRIIGYVGGKLLGVMVAVFFAIFFYVLFTPIAFMLRVAGKDVLMKNRKNPQWQLFPEKNNEPKTIEKQY